MKLLWLCCLCLAGTLAHASHEVGFSQLVYQIRDPNTDPAHFRGALMKIGEYLALDILEQLRVKDVQIQTLTQGTATHSLLEEQPVIVTILRAGLPLCQGVQTVFPNAEVGFIAMARNEKTLQAKVDYVALPQLKNKVVILADTMIASGGSILDALKIIEAKGPTRIFVLGAIASQSGLKRITQAYPSVQCKVAAIDPILNDKGYIVPGLGDAGDRSYGLKRD